MDRSIDMLVALLAILKAGGAYVPLDPRTPDTRLAWMLADSGAKLLLANDPHAARLSAFGPRVLRPGAAWNVAEDQHVPDPVVPVQASNLAYIIYTSGSTGRPKGVAVTHSSVVSMLRWSHEVFSAEEQASVLASTSIAFDISVFEIYSTLARGGTVVLVESILHISDAPAAFTPTLVNTVPSALSSLLTQGALPDSVQTICLSGELLPARLAQEILRKPGRAPRLVNLYGPTETTVYSTWSQVVSASDAAPPIGMPIANTRVYILDAQRQPVPAGEGGELYIGGCGLARGYWNRPDLTAEKFMPDPFSAEPGARMYASGDLARLRQDGNLEYLGRGDTQVKLRGFRVELGEIESVLGMHPALRGCALGMSADERGNQRLVAYMVSSTGISATELRRYLREKLPDHMFPAVFVTLAALPLTTSGKLDRLALPEPPVERPSVDTPFEPLATPTEQRLAAIWDDLLKVSRVGRRDNFFELGGHSLLVVKLMLRVRDAFGVELSVRYMFEAQTLQELASHIDRLAPLAPDRQSVSINMAPRGRSGPLSFGQERLWFLSRLAPESAAYNVPLAFSLSGSLDRDALEQALLGIMERHESLRTTFAELDGLPHQMIGPLPAAILELVDLSTLPAPEREPAARRALAAAARQPFDLPAGPLLRATLWKLGESEHIVLICIHHILFDGWSQDIFFWELEALYAAYRDGHAPALAPLAIQAADYAARQRAWWQRPEFDTQLAHWLERLRPRPGEQLPVVTLPWDRPRPAVQGFRGARHVLEIPAALWERLRELGRREGVTLFMTLLAAFQTLLFRVSGQDDLYIGVPVADRKRLDTEGLIGFLVNTVVLRTDLKGDPRFRELLARVRGVVLDALANQDMPLEKLVASLRPERSASHESLFQVMFAFETMRSDGMSLRGIGSSPLDIDSGTSKFDLLFSVTGTRHSIRTVFEYDTDLFDAATIERLAERFRVLLDAIVANPDERIGRLMLVPVEQQTRMLVEWNSTDVSYDRDSTIPAVFEAQVERTPDAVALVMGDERLTYRALNAQANRLANHLRAQGVRAETAVAIYMDRSLDTVVSVLAILKAGGVYVPLSPSMPGERCAFIVADTRARVVLTQERIAKQLPLWTGTPPAVLCVETVSVLLRSEPAVNPDVSLAAENLAYVMYTSGSTGRPKGVATTHRGVLRLVQHGGYAHLGTEETLIHFAPLAFDASTLEIWGSLLNGARLIVCPEQIVSMSELADVLNRHEVTALWLTAALFHEFVAAVPRLPRSLRQLLAGGDVLLSPVVQKALSQWSGCRLTNGYGPTEGTTFTCCYPVADASAIAQTVPIGRPIANTQVYILDESLQPTPVGVEGELYIAGDGLARGYLNRPDLTAELFIPNPFAVEPGGRLYRTGDRVRYRLDGNIEFLGRKDRQVKIRGFRVEPAEIETALAENSTVQASVVVASRNAAGDTRLIAYVVGRGGSPPVVAALRRYLEARLPDYMVPAEWVTMQALPVTPNGKIDLGALPVPYTVSLPAVPEAVAPRDRIEQSLVGIWEEVLGVKPIGVRDNFFELGGHSLVAIRVAMRIERQLDRKLPVSVLFRAPTIETLAAYVRGSQSVPDWSTLVPIQPAGKRPPFFCVHGFGGGVVDYGELARRLGNDQPFYGLQARGLNGTEEPHESIEAMAAHYVDAMRSLQPDGPYYLGGYCFGGVIAYEMARLLVAQDQTVGLLGILEGYARVPGDKRQRWLRAAQWKGLVRNLPYWLQDYGALKLSNALSHVWRGTRLDRPRERRVWDVAVARHALAATVPGAPDIPAAYTRLMQAQLAAMLAHRSGRYAGRLTLFRVRALAFSRADDSEMGWGRLSEEGVAIRMIPGAHYNILAAPNVEWLAAELKACLDAAQAPNT